MDKVDVILPPLSPTSRNSDGIVSAPLVDVPPQSINSESSTFSQEPTKRMLFKLNPNVLRIEEKPFDPEAFVEEDNPTVAVRHRSAQNPDGTSSVESNARIVTWSDGSKQILVGDKAFDLVDDIPRKLLRGVTFPDVSGKVSGQKTSITEDVKGNSAQTKQDQKDLHMRQEQEDFPARQEQVELPVRQEQVDLFARKEDVDSRTTQEHVSLLRRQDVDLHTRQAHPNLQMEQVHVSVQPQEPGIVEVEDANDPITDKVDDGNDPEIGKWEYESDPEEDPDYMEDQN